MPRPTISGGVVLGNVRRTGADRFTFVDAVAVREAAAGRVKWNDLRPRERVVVALRLHERGWNDYEGWGPKRIRAWLDAPNLRTVERSLERATGHERRLVDRHAW